MDRAKLLQIVNELERCNFECEAGSLENNTAFMELKAMATGEVLQDDVIGWAKGKVLEGGD